MFIYVLNKSKKSYIVVSKKKQNVVGCEIRFNNILPFILNTTVHRLYHTGLTRVSNVLVFQCGKIVSWFEISMFKHNYWWFWELLFQYVLKVYNLIRIVKVLENKSCFNTNQCFFSDLCWGSDFGDPVPRLGPVFWFF